MKRTRLIAAVVPLLLLTVGSGAMAAGPVHGTGRWNVKAGNKGGIVRARGTVKDVQGPWRGATNRASSSPNMTNHGGPVMTSVTTAAIFWGPKWGDGTTAFAGDKITGLNTFYSGWGSSGYAGTVTEYTSSGSAATATNRSTHNGSAIDTSTASGGQRTTPILNEVAKMVNAGRITIPLDGTAYVAVYTDLPRGSAQYCAWHSTGTFSKTGSSTPVRVQFAFFWALDGDPGCDPADTSGQHSQGLAALANVTGHELAEAITDPRLNAWYDGSGAENADKCAWTFNVPLVSFTGGSQWKIQGEWSNKAYTNGTGYANRSGQKGCIDGH